MCNKAQHLAVDQFDEVAARTKGDNAAAVMVEATLGMQVQAL